LKDKGYFAPPVPLANNLTLNSPLSLSVINDPMVLSKNKIIMMINVIHADTLNSG